jgi:hypothetical protein
MSISQRIRKQMEQPNGLTQEKLEPLAAEFSAAVAPEASTAVVTAGASGQHA